MARRCQRGRITRCSERTPESVASRPSTPGVFFYSGLRNRAVIESARGSLLPRGRGRNNRHEGVSIGARTGSKYAPEPIPNDGCCPTMNTWVRAGFKRGCWPANGVIHGVKASMNCKAKESGWDNLRNIAGIFRGCSHFVTDLSEERFR